MADQTLLAIDFGTKYMGTAVGDTITRTAQPLASLKAKQGVPDWEALDLLIDRWKPDGIVMGLPLNMDGTEQPVSQQARSCLASIEARYQLPCFWAEEQLTTLAAREELFEAYGYKGLTKENVDCFSARLILEQWLRTRG